MESQYDAGNRLEWSDPAEWEGMNVYDPSGDKIGEVDDVYVDDLSGRPEWMQVDLGVFSGKRLLPASGTQRSSDGIHVPYMKDQIKDSPRLSGDAVTIDEERDLYEYYGLRQGIQEREVQRPAQEPVGHPAPAVGTSVAPEDTRSFDQPRQAVNEPVGHGSQELQRPEPATHAQPDLGIRTVRRPRELVRLRKRIVTEPVQTTVPVQREELVVERVPISESGEVRGGTPQEGGQDIVLEGEEVVVENPPDQPGQHPDEESDTRAA